MACSAVRLRTSRPLGSISKMRTPVSSPALPTPRTLTVIERSPSGSARRSFSHAPVRPMARPMPKRAFRKPAACSLCGVTYSPRLNVSTANSRPMTPSRLSARPRAEAGGAQDGELGRLREPRHRVDRADQHGDREQLVHVSRLRQQHGQRGRAHRVAVAAHAAHLVDEVDEEEQRDEEHGHEEDRPQHVAVEEVADGLHAALRRSSSFIGWITVACSRHQMSPMLSRNASPCSPTSATTMFRCPLPTHDCDRFSRL